MSLRRDKIHRKAKKTLTWVVPDFLYSMIDSFNLYWITFVDFDTLTCTKDSICVTFNTSVRMLLSRIINSLVRSENYLCNALLHSIHLCKQTFKRCLQIQSTTTISCQISSMYRIFTSFTWYHTIRSQQQCGFHTLSCRSSKFLKDFIQQISISST